MTEVAPISSRKSDHLRIIRTEMVDSGLTTGLERYRFIHRALPELNLEQTDPSVSLFEKKLQAPILIFSMTGGTPEASAINRTLAEAAQVTGIAMGLGSQRAAIEHPELNETYHVRDVAPDILLFANLGAVQLNYSYVIDECLRAVEMVAADALILHFNALQEAVQPDGDTKFSGLAKEDCFCVPRLTSAGDCERGRLGILKTRHPVTGRLWSCSDRCCRCWWYLLVTGGNVSRHR